MRPQIQVVLDGLSPLPVSVVTERFDVLAWNAAYEVLFPRMRQVPPEERNTLLYLFAGRDCCSVVENRADQRAALVAQLRAALRAPRRRPGLDRLHPADGSGQPRVRGHVGHPGRGPARTTSPRCSGIPLYPRLEMTSTSFAVQGTSGTRMVVYTPDNETTRAAMERLVAGPVQHHFPCWPAHQARTRDLLTI